MRRLPYAALAAFVTALVGSTAQAANRQDRSEELATTSSAPTNVAVSANADLERTSEPRTTAPAQLEGFVALLAGGLLMFGARRMIGDENAS